MMEFKVGRFLANLREIYWESHLFQMVDLRYTTSIAGKIEIYMGSLTAQYFERNWY